MNKLDIRIGDIIKIKDGVDTGFYLGGQIGKVVKLKDDDVLLEEPIFEVDFGLKGIWWVDVIEADFFSEKVVVKDTINFAKIKPSAIIPSKKLENAGYDIYACFEEDTIEVKPHETVMIPAGIASACSTDYYFQLFERGSTGTKGIGQRCGVIDSGYRNEWFIPVTNHNTKTLLITKLKSFGSIKDNYIIYPYEKAICQAVLLPVPVVNVVELSYEQLLKIESDRKFGDLGSTGK